MASRIFVVEDEPIISASIQRRLEQIGYEIAGTGSSGESAIRQIDRQRPDLVLMDVKLEGAMDGVEAASAIQNQFGIPVIFLTAYADEATIQRARDERPFGYIVKPFTDRELASAVEIALERSALERRLRESKHRYRMLSEVIADYAFCIRIATDAADDSLEWEIGSLSDAAGVDVQRFRGMDDLAHLLHPDDVASLRRYWEELRQGGRGQLEVRFLDGHGGERWAKLDAKFGATSEGVPCIYGAFQDITTLRETERELVNTKFEFAQIVQRLKQSIWVSDPDGTCIYVNQAFLDLTGFSLDQLVGRESLDNLLTVSTDSDGEPFEAEVQTRDREKVPVLVTVRSNDGEGSAVYLMVDISRQKRAEALLERGARKLQGVFRQSPTPSILIEATTNEIVDVNQAFTERLGFTPGQIVGTGGFGLAEYQSLDDLNTMISLFRERSETGSTMRLRSADGRSRVFAIQIREIVVDDEELLMLLLEDSPES